MKYLMMAVIVGSLWAMPVLGADAGKDTRGVAPKQEGLQVIEEKCLVCHNRQRIDDAVKERRRLETVLKAMEKQGVTVTEQERKVMGHFWGKPMFK